MVANLTQNPLQRPIVAQWLPALLKQGTMWIMFLNGFTDPECEERWLSDEDDRMMGMEIGMAILQYDYDL